ncbi:Cytochrome P450 6a2 [Eumeta japonica]|uniref:unspecific monooxygenase n=1 Tax=Eumeta variegata TaxID=151549 RepID=A0A4C1SPA0_EUMVA|nr:Cytochrome P450 6a2 [Eumeta japonica]
MYTVGLLKVQQVFDKSLQEKLNQHEVVCNISELVEGFNIDVISTLAFSLEGDSLRYKDTKFRAMCKNYTQENNNIYKTYFAFCYPRLARLLQYRLYSPEATSYFQKLINDKLYEREYQRSHHSAYDFLQICYDYRKTCTNNQAFENIDKTEIAAEAFSFIPAGLDSCTTTVSCCLYELALQPDIQQKTRREIHAILRKYENKLNENSLNEMVYLKQVLYGKSRFE